MPQTDDKIVDIDGKKYYAYNFPRPSMTVDCIIFGVDVSQAIWEIRKPEYKMSVLLIQRKNPPFQNQWALPGGFVDMDETSLVAAQRELKEETGVEIPKESMHFVGVFDEPNRDPRGRVVSMAYTTRVRIDDISPKAADDARDVKWLPLDEINQLAFDHTEIIKAARAVFEIK